ncbi:two-component sensor histidine kinase [Saonia flava]|uniref:histidine kinase n=1 Tax=Saonia flava TaxID=523696 RepID=A0A846QT06_9FLAO|nr:histidine kinase dimerization/phosphoacceptor domain -containing protein [Saonia flava]NJB69652.1 two-component sensor histidine kinase [Saonia flava]
MIKKICCKIKCALIVLFLTGACVFAQDSLSTEENLLKKFQDAENANGRYFFFFDTLNRYNENSAYDWLDAVNIYHNNSYKINDSSAIRQYKLIQSQLYHDIGDYDKSIAITKELYTEINKLDLETKERLLNIMDNAYSKLELYDKQIEIREEKRHLGLTSDVAFYDIYSNLGLHRKAMEDYIVEVKKTISEDDHYGLAEYNNNVGNFLRLDRSAPTAFPYFKKALSYIDLYLIDITEEKTEREVARGNLLKGIIEGNIGKCHVQLKEYEEALPFLEKSIESINENHEGVYSEDVIENTLNLVDCHLQLKNYKLAKEYLDQELRITNVAHIIKKNRLLALYYDMIEDYKNASFYLKKNVKIADSVDLTTPKLKRQQLAAVAEKQMEISRSMINQQKLEMEKTRNELASKDEKMSLVFISLIFTLLGFAGLVFAYLKSIKNQRLIAKQKHIIENSLVEKDSLLKEIHHRVKNNLQMVSSLLSLQTKNTRSKAAIEALEEGKSRVKAMALIHQKLYQNDDLSVIEMQGYIESLINSVQSVYKKGGHNINITIDTEGVELDIDRAIPFGLILNELVSNSFKYAFPDGDENGKIYIHLRKNDDQGYFEYTDNGVGLPEDTDERANSSMGIRLMNRLVNQLQSTLNIDKTVDGVRFWFNFK